MLSRHSIHRLSVRQLRFIDRKFLMAARLSCKLVLCGLLLSLATSSRGFTCFVCNAYQQPELVALCYQFVWENIAIDTHYHVDADDLNQLRDSWGDKPGLHIIPGKRYNLNKTLVLDNHQGLLPLPPKNPADQLAAIQLSPAAGFKPLPDNNSLLGLMAGSRAGGIVMEASSPFSHQLADNGFSLVSIPSVDSVELAVSYLSGPQQAFMDQLIRIGRNNASISGSSSGPVSLNRVLVVAGQAGTAVKIQGGAGQTVKLTNSLIETEADAIHTEGAMVQLLNTELYLAGKRSGSQSIKTTGSRIISLESIFWADHGGVAIFADDPFDQSGNTTSGWLVNSLFSSRLTAINAEDETELIYSNNYQLGKGSPAPLNNWSSFQQYTGKLGLARIPAEVMTAACKTDTKTAIQPEKYEQSVSFDQSGFQIREFASTRDFSCPDACPTIIPWGAYAVVGSATASVIMHLSAMIIGGICGYKYRGRKGYAELNSVNSQ